MDPVELIVAAIVAGALAGTQEVTAQVIKDAYTGLKALILRKFGGQGEVKDALEMVEKRPDAPSRQTVLTEELTQAGAAESSELLQQAQALWKLLEDHDQAVRPGYAASVTGLGAIAQGDGATAHLDARMQTVQTDGGAVMTGPVNTGGGDVVMRDQYNTTYINEQAPPDELLRLYYRSLADDCRALPLGIVDPNFVRPGGKGEVSLSEVYVDLDVVAPVREEGEDLHAWGLRLSRGDEGERTPLLDALGRPEAAKVVLLGDPGSGKTTFVNYLTYWLAEQAAGQTVDAAAIPEALRQRFPVRLVLRDVAAHLPADTACGTAALLWDALYADLCARLGQPAAKRLWPTFQDRVCRGGIFLLDGLDEVPEAGRRRACLLEAVKNLTASLLDGPRMILTARPYAYTDPALQLAAFQTLALAPFNAEQIAHFVDVAVQALGKNRQLARAHPRIRLRAC